MNEYYFDFLVQRLTQDVPLVIDLEKPFGGKNSSINERPPISTTQFEAPNRHVLTCFNKKFNKLTLFENIARTARKRPIWQGNSPKIFCQERKTYSKLTTEIMVEERW